MSIVWKLLLVVTLFLILWIIFINLPEKIKSFTAAPGEVVELVFELDKKFEFGEYYFDLANGRDANHPLCFCLTERNTYPPDCFGDVKYIYNNTPGTTCIPLNIGTGSCTSKIMSSMGHATVFMIPLEYQWTKPVEKIVMGIRIPNNAPVGARMVVEVSILKKNDRGKLVRYRKFEQAIEVKSERK